MKKHVILAALLLCGCDLKTHELHFNSPGNIRVKDTYNACAFIGSIDDTPVSKDMLQEGKIVVSEKLYVSCSSSFIPEKIGEHLLEYRINDRKTQTFTVNVVDDIPPVISSRKDEYEVEEGNAYFDINNEVSFSDNYDEEFLHSLDHSINIDGPGDYEVKAYAKDSSGNEARKTILVKVIEKQIETIYVNAPGTASGGSSHSGTSAPQQSSSQSSPAEPPSQSSPAPSASSPQPVPASSPSPAGISGVHDISVGVGTDMDTVFFLLSGIDASSAVSIDISEVNTSAQGTYTVYYSAADGSSASCTVTVY